MPVLAAKKMSRVFSAFGLFAAGMFLAVPKAMADESGDSGLPQMDATLFPEQLFWLAIAFGVLYVAMAFVALPRVAATKANRAETIATQLATAHSASETAKATAAATDKSLIEARAKAMAQISEQVAEVAADSASTQAAQERDMLHKLHRAEADIAVAREAALRSVSASANELATALVDKCLSTGKRMAS